MVVRVLIPLADGFEELEAISIIDVLRRVGCEVILASLKTSLEVSSQGKVKFIVDKSIFEIQADCLDAVVFPGGWEGTQNLANSESLKHILEILHNKGKIIGAICAAPLALFKMGILENKRFTCYPGIEGMITNNYYQAMHNVVEDANIITSRGPATALEFAFILAEKLVGLEKTQEIKKGMLVL